MEKTKTESYQASDNTSASQIAKHSLMAFIVGSVISIFIAPFLSPLLFSIGTIFGREYLGYDGPFSYEWYGSVAAVTSAYFVLFLNNWFEMKNVKSWKRILPKYIIGFILMWLILGLFGPAYSFICKFLCI